MDMMQECYLMRHVIFLLPKGSGLTNKMNTLIFRMTDTGLLKKHFNDQMDKVRRISTEKKKTAEKTLTLHDLQGIFWIFGILVVLSGVLFAIELSLFRKVRSKDDVSFLQNDKSSTITYY